MKKINFLGDKLKFALENMDPKVLVRLGIVGFVATTVVACVATKKSAGTHEEFADERNGIEADLESEKIEKKEYNKSMAKSYAREALAYTKDYGPAIALGVASTALIEGGCKAYDIKLNKVTTAYGVLLPAYNELRKRVAAESGKDESDRIATGVKTKAREIIETDENGKERIHVEKVRTLEAGDEATALTGSPYALLIGRINPDGTENPHWQNRMEGNYAWISARLDRLSDDLRIRGHYYLDEVAYELCGYANTDWHNVGYLYDYTSPISHNEVATVQINQVHIIRNGDREAIGYSSDNTSFSRGDDDIRILVEFEPDGLINRSLRQKQQTLKYMTRRKELEYAK